MINVSSTQTFLDPFHRVQHIKKSFPIITTYNPMAAKITARTFSIQMLFPCSLRPHIEISKICFQLLCCGATYRFKTLISQHSTSAYQIWSFFLLLSLILFDPTHKNTKWKKTLFDGKVFCGLN